MTTSARTGRGASVRIEGLSRRFGARRVLSDLSLTIRPGEFVTVVGQSGSGKSTLLRILCGLDDDAEGTLQIDQTHCAPEDAVRVMFQEPRLLPWRSTLDNVRVGVRTAESEQRARQVLAAVGLLDRLHDYPGTLSGGQKQRVALARALFHEPALMLLDEPFGALDALTRIGAQRLVEKLWLERGFSALLVTHDVEEAVLLGDRVLVFDEGKIVQELSVGLPRPRTREHPEVGRLTGLLLGAILSSERTAAAASDTEEQHDTTYVSGMEAPARG